MKRGISMKRLLLYGLVLVALMVVPGTARAEEMSFVATLTGDNEVPAAATGATGVAHVVVDTDTNKLRFEVHVFDFTNTLVASHIHRGPAGVNGPVIYPFTPPTVQPLSGELAFNPADLADLMTGNMYVNVHSNVFPGGELRGQLEAGSFRGISIAFNQPMSPENEVPPHSELDAGARSVVTLDLKLMGNRVVAGWTAFEVTYRFSTSALFQGLHVHKAPAGVNGPIVIDSTLRPTADADGRGNFTFRVPAGRAAVLAIFEGILSDPSQFYINLHTSVFPGGAVRGQLMRRRVGR
jgi:hypothetical protein